MANKNKTPAYVDKAIQRLEEEAPHGESLAFINDQEKRLLKSLGGSGEEAVGGIPSYQPGPGVPGDFIQRRREEEEEQERTDFIDQLREATQQLEDFDFGGPRSYDPEQFAPRVGGAEAIRRAEQTDPSELAIPTVPTAPPIDVPQFTAGQDELVSP